jgi:FkbM family methyltransferase
MMQIIKDINRQLRRFDFQVKKYPDVDLKRRMQLIGNNNINVLVDVGANEGQYALLMRDLGFQHKIVSFEPLKQAFEKLEVLSLKDRKWQVENFALGSENAKSIIHISSNSFSSSLLEILPVHLKNAPESKYVAQQEVEVKTLDSVFDTICGIGDRVMLKIDTQGFEKNVLEGAIESLKMISIIQVEMSVVPLYEGEMIFTEMIKYLQDKGFCLRSLENGFSDQESGQLLQVDGIFSRRTALDT